MEDYKMMKCKMVEIVKDQLERNPDGVCTAELGEAIDIIKDLEECIYYHTITDAMKSGDYTPAMVNMAHSTHTEVVK